MAKCSQLTSLPFKGLKSDWTEYTLHKKNSQKFIRYKTAQNDPSPETMICSYGQYMGCNNGQVMRNSRLNDSVECLHNVKTRKTFLGLLFVYVYLLWSVFVPNFVIVHSDFEKTYFDKVLTTKRRMTVYGECLKLQENVAASITSI